jgi:hypothetical protein
MIKILFSESIVYTISIVKKQKFSLEESVLFPELMFIILVMTVNKDLLLDKENNDIKGDIVLDVDDIIGK